jgi:hypothetical protein
MGLVVALPRCGERSWFFPVFSQCLRAVVGSGCGSLTLCTSGLQRMKIALRVFELYMLLVRSRTILP